MTELEDALAGLADVVAGGRPESGTVAALTVALAARLLAAATDDRVLGERALAHARRADALATGNLAAHEAARAVLRDTDAVGAAARETIERSAAVPLGIVTVAADVARLATAVAPGVRAEVVADVAGAASLAAGAAHAAAGLVVVNLVAGTDDLLVDTARELAADATAGAAQLAL